MSEHPYAVSDYSYLVKEITPPQEGRHGVYLTTERQKIDYEYNCCPFDPVTTHHVVLVSDDFGNPCQTVTLHYPRRDGSYALRSSLEKVSYVNRTTDSHYIGIAVETETFELHGFSSSSYFTYEDLRQQVNGAAICSYGHAFSPKPQPEARLLTRTRSFYWDDDLLKPLPLGRLVQTESPQQLEAENSCGYLHSKVVYGLWEQKFCNNNQTLPESDYYAKFCATYPSQATFAQRDQKEVNEKVLTFASNCKTALMDNCGNKVAEFIDEKKTTYFEYDGANRLTVVARPRQAANKQFTIKYSYDMLGNVICVNSCDSGCRYELKNSFGATMVTIDAMGHRFTTTYDALMRPIKTELATVGCIQKTQYGERIAQAKENNLIGQIYQSTDQSGQTTYEAYNIFGAVLQSARQLRTIDAVSQRCQNIAMAAPFEPTIYRERFVYNALSAITQQICPDGRKCETQYDDFGQLLSVVMDGLVILEHVTYNAAGMKELVRYGNGLESNYSYDPYRLLLKRMVTVKHGQGEPIRASDLAYTVDPNGNVSRIRDHLDTVIYAQNQQVLPVWDYCYDETDQLIRATGRMQQGVATDYQNLSPYTQQYQYDFDENMTTMKHSGGGCLHLKNGI